LTAAASLDLTALHDRLAGVEVVVACDVDNPLTGPDGAASTYGPQKGADPEQVKQLDTALSHWADLVARETGRDLRDTPGAGAAGGVGFAALALLGAELRPGIELMLDLVGFHEHLAGADLVITGEGALDEQTLHGKAVAGVAAAAQAAGVPVVAVCGTNRLDPARLRQSGIATAYALTDLEPNVRRCIADPVPLLRQLGEGIAAAHLPRSTMTPTERGVVWPN
jgi:glycerate kinase